MAKVAYSAIVLSPESHNQLVSACQDLIPEGFEVLCHHVTIKMGELPPELKPSIGLPVKLKALSFHGDDKVMAVEVEVPSELRPFIKNAHPHITVAVNRANGGKPMMSNALIALGTSGQVFGPLNLMGQIQEVFQ